MNKLTRYIPKRSLGDIKLKFSTDLEYKGYYLCDGRILLNADNTELRDFIGLIPDNLYNYTLSSFTSVSACFDGTNYIYGYSNGDIKTTTDNINFSSFKFNDNLSLLRIKYSSGKYIAENSLGEFGSSTNLTNWNYSVLSRVSGSDILSYIYGERYAYIADSTYIYTSTNNINWSVNKPPLGVTKLTYTNGIYFSYGSSGRLYSSTNATNWTTLTSGTTYTIYSVAYRGGNYHYGSFLGGIGSSTDAINWTFSQNVTKDKIVSLQYAASYIIADNYAVSTSTNGANWTYNSICRNSTSVYKYVNSVHFAADSGRLYSSTNAINWTYMDRGSLSYIYGIYYLGSKYLCCGAGGYLASSTNYINWTTLTSGTSSDIRCMMYDSSKYIVFGSGGMGRSSTDLINWTAITTGVTSTIYSCIYNSPSYTAGGGYLSSGRIITSTNGVNWTPTTVSGTPRDGKYLNSKFVYATDYGYVLSSTNGINWTSKTVDLSATFYSVHYFSSKWIAAGSYTTGGCIFTSTDIVNWARANSPSSNLISVQDLNSNASTLVAAAGGGIYLSTDISNWNFVNDKNPITMFTYQNSLYFYGTSIGTLKSSTNAVNWTARTVGTTDSITSLIYAGTTYVLSTDAGGIYTSTNYANWTLRTSGTTGVISEVVYLGGNFYYYTTVSTFAKSTDAINWVIQPKSFNLTELGYFNNRYIATGTLGNFKTSTNLSNWNEESLLGTSDIIRCVCDSSPECVCVGDSGAVFSSTNAITWTTITTPFSTSNIWYIKYDGSKYIYAVGGKLYTSTNNVNFSDPITISTTSLLYIDYTEGIYTCTGNSKYIYTSTDCYNWNSGSFLMTSTSKGLIKQGANTILIDGTNIYTNYKYSYDISTEFCLPTQVDINSQCFNYKMPELKVFIKGN